MTNEIEVHISGMIFNQSLGGTYSLVLSESTGLRRRFSMLIGESEAQSIALKLNNTKSPRPLSHDLMNSIIRELNAKLTKIVIYEMKNDIFYSELYLTLGEKPIIIDARTSDAVALAVRSNAPIYIKSEILDIVGTAISEEGSGEKKGTTRQQISINNLNRENVIHLSGQKLEELLKEALEEENYEIAAILRDEMSNRS